MKRKFAFVFSSDQNYFFLAKGMLSSIEDNIRTLFDFYVIDIGLHSASKEWLAKQGIHILTFERNKFVRIPPNFDLPHYSNAQICRPFLKNLMPNYDIYIWCDVDFWFQSTEGLILFLDQAQHNPDNIIICPELHYGLAFTRNQKSAQTASKIWYTEIFSEEIAEEYFHRPMLNSGFTALHHKSPIWHLWAKEIQRGYSKKKQFEFTNHITEQVALNYVVYKNNLFIPADPIYNFPCAASAVQINSHGQLTIAYPPHSLVKGVHLLSFSRYADFYFKNNFLYKNGTYLEADELSECTNRFATQDQGIND